MATTPEPKPQTPAASLENPNPSIDKTASLVALDDLYKEVTGEAPPVVRRPDEDEPAAPKPEADAKPEPEPQPDATDPKDSTDPDQDPDQTADQKPPDDHQDAAPTASGADPDDQGTAKSTDDLDAVQLPPHTSRKASEAFASIKQKAREQLTARDTRIQELEGKLQASEARVTVTPEERTELESLRKFRASAELERDPVFTKQHDDRVAANDSVVYRELKGAGMTDQQLDEIKKMGGPNKLANWDAIYEHLSPTQKRIIDARLND